jgi:uncharacterized UPF0160 family protein
MVVPRSFGTHSGSFHADEVTACALLLFFDQIDRTKILRTRTPAEWSQCDFLCDVGGLYQPEERRFDHHQSAYSGSLSSAGMVWKYLRDHGVVHEAVYVYFQDSLILGVDAIDNGQDFPKVGHCSFSQVISNFVPPAYDAGAAIYSRAFDEALDFVLGHIKRLWDRFQYIQSCREKVAMRMAQGDYALIFDEALPWMDNFFDMEGEKHPALFVIMPSGEHWKLRGIPPSSAQKMLVRMELPEAWAGLIDEELRRASGIPGAIFCHKGRFTSVWESKEDALKALDLTLAKGLGR